MREQKMSSWDTQIRKFEIELEYKGCRNCRHQISPLRMCEWAEHDGDGQIHLICPMWDKKVKNER